MGSSHTDQNFRSVNERATLDGVVYFVFIYVYKASDNVVYFLYF